jgi:undecaprenyl diphosphate synthase
MTVQNDAGMPNCVGLILDGNRRWAKERGLPTLEGHREGAKTFENAVRWISARGIPHVVAYVFSTENWKRTEEEVGYMIGLLKESIKTRINELIKENVRVKIVGDRSQFDAELQEMLNNVERTSEGNTGITTWLCLSYGGRAEIVQAARAIAASHEEITEKSFSQYLWTAGMPDPDIIVRTGGQRRLSNFLTWQSTYSEFFFLNEYWPAFSEASLDAVLNEFTSRKRNFGK